MAELSKVVFGTKLSVTDFKAKFGVSKLEVVLNPNTNKLFVSANGKSIASVSSKYNKDLDKEFIEMTPEDTGVVSWCLHNPSNVNVVETL